MQLQMELNIKNHLIMKFIDLNYWHTNNGQLCNNLMIFVDIALERETKWEIRFLNNVFGFNSSNTMRRVLDSSRMLRTNEMLIVVCDSFNVHHASKQFNKTNFNPNTVF